MADVEAVGLMGVLDHAQVKNAFGQRWPEVDACYQSGIQGASFIGGDLALKFRVAAEGRVERVWVAASDLGAWPVERCLLDLARSIVFPAPNGGAADAGMTFHFRGRGRVAAARQSADLRDALRSIDGCVEPGAAFRESPAIVTLYVGREGRVLSAGFAMPRGDLDGAWADCAHDRARGWTLRMPRPRGDAWKVQAPWGGRVRR